MSADGNTAVVGVGAIGTVAAASLMARGQRPVLCVRSTFDRVQIRAPKTCAVYESFDLETSPHGVAKTDIVVLATKTHQTASAAGWLSALTHDSSIVLVLQNGVEHVERTQPFVARGANVVPGIVDIPAQRTAPGCVDVRRAGTITLPRSVAAERLVPHLGLHAAVADVRLADDFDRQMWKKLCVNVVSGAIPTLTDRPAGVFRETEIRAVARRLVEECATVARALGVKLDEELPDEVVAGFSGSAPDAVNSMLRDRREGRPLEAESRNGAVARLGERVGVDTPYNRMASAILGAINRGRVDEASASDAVARRRAEHED